MSRKRLIVCNTLLYRRLTRFHNKVYGTAVIRHIYDCIRKIEEYAPGGKKEFLDDSKTQDAVIRNIEIIGQAVKDFGSQELASHYGGVPWQQIAGIRDILAHQYLGVDIELTWDVVERDLPVLKSKIREIAKDMDVELDAHR